jgi:succinate dehydrogenase/fumarate reductase flavoprotein subunit
MVKLEEAKKFIEIFDVCMMPAEGRTESRESFYRSGYPYTDNVDWFCWHTVRLDGAERRFGRVPIPRDNYRRQAPKMPDRMLSPLARNLSESNPIL